MNDTYIYTSLYKDHLVFGDGGFGFIVCAWCLHFLDFAAVLRNGFAFGTEKNYSDTFVHTFRQQ
jgi:hypothetical protein